MFPDFGELFKPHVDALKPHLDTAQDVLRSMCDTLGRIEENTRDKPFTPDRDRLWLPFQITAAFSGGTPGFVSVVPPTEDWEMEVYRAGSTASGVVKFFDSPNKGTGEAPLGFVSVGDITTNLGITSGNGVVVPGGTSIYAVGAGSTAVVNGVIQVRRRRRNPARPGVGGDMLPGPSGDAEEPKAEPSRHIGTWTTNRA